MATAWLWVLPALARADERSGGLVASSLTVVRTNSFGIAEDLRLGYRLDLGELDSTFLLPYAQAAISPANAQFGVGLTLGIIRGLSLTVAYAPRFNFAGRYGFQSFGSPRDDYRDQVLANRADADLTYTAWQHRFVLELEAGVPLGPLVLHDVARVVKHSATLRQGDTVFYDFQLDVLVAAHGWTLENATELLWLPDGRWVLGVRNTLVQAWYPDGAYRPGEPRDNPNAPMLRLGPMASYTFHRRGSGFFDAPTVFVDVGWWLRHRYRTGEDVSGAIPTVLAGFTFKSW
jgi:hypothetical protein